MQCAYQGLGRVNSVQRITWLMPCVNSVRAQVENLVLPLTSSQRQTIHYWSAFLHFPETKEVMKEDKVFYRSLASI
jgi:hypothetical protein